MTVKKGKIFKFLELSGIYEKMTQSNRTETRVVDKDTVELDKQRVYKFCFSGNLSRRSGHRKKQTCSFYKRVADLNDDHIRIFQFFREHKLSARRYNRGCKHYSCILLDTVVHTAKQNKVLNSSSSH